ncbi:hypothetical protein F2Q69_00022779 [Brassica cretica]|uniref:Uncharacterized protein n=1 Tax=Brassica cretica TaxID=69181 RepID=A0A3N6PUU0_BRACR|nr:hypothetical protein F2Q69_00022779 [Brassica cretica]
MESGTSDSTFSVDDRDTWVSRRCSERAMLTKMPRGCILDDLRSSDETSRRRWVTEQTVKKTMVKTTV